MKRVVFILIVLSCTLCISPPNYAAIVDLTTVGATGTINDAIFQQLNPDTSAGTGVFDSFVRIQAAGIEQGYNTDGTVEFETKAGAWTHSLMLSAVPTLQLGSTVYREFCLDINQNGQSILSLDELEIYLADTGDLTGYPTDFGPVIYDLDAGEDNWVEMNYDLNAGSGKGDIAFLCPDSIFGEDDSKYVYFYSKMGVNMSSDDGFEEWGVGVGGPITTPEPATIVLLGLGALALRRKR